jgi:hypothetical protein
MMQKVVTLIIALGALFFIGSGITGFATLDQGGMCKEDIDCEFSKCCPVFQQDYGMCAAESQCDEIYLSSKVDSSVYRAPDIASNIERNYIAVALGVIMLMILGIVGYLEWMHEKGLKKKKSRK